MSCARILVLVSGNKFPRALRQSTKASTPQRASSEVHPGRLPYLTRAGHARMALPVQLKTESLFEPIELPTQALLAESEKQARCRRTLETLCEACAGSTRTGTSMCQFYTTPCTSACACPSCNADRCNAECCDSPDKLCASLCGVCQSVCEAVLQ